MTHLHKLLMACLLFGLIGCEDKGPKPASQLQQSFESEAVQTLQGIEQLKSRLAMNPDDFSILSQLGDEVKRLRWPIYHIADSCCRACRAAEATAQACSE